MMHEDAIDDLLERRAAGTRHEITENDLVMTDAQIDDQNKEMEDTDEPNDIVPIM